MLVNCKTCQIEFKRANNKHKFCSLKCSSISKRTSNKVCSDCGEKRDKGAKSKLCRTCLERNKIERRGKQSVGEAKIAKGPSVHMVTRNHARSVMFYHRVPKNCVVCGYSKYVERCHIRPLSSFEPSTPIRLVNSLENLVFLCPNHHKELDRGILSSEHLTVIEMGSVHLSRFAGTERQSGSEGS